MSTEPPLNEEAPPKPKKRRSRAKSESIDPPPPPPTPQEVLGEALSELAAARTLLEAAQAARENHVRLRLGLVPPRALAPEAERVAYEARIASGELEAALAHPTALDALEEPLLAQIAAIELLVAEAQARFDAAREAVVAEFGEKEAAIVIRKAPVHLERKRGFHHWALVDTAIRVSVARLRKGGPSQVTMRGVAHDLGVSGAALSHHFGNLDGLHHRLAGALLVELSLATRTPLPPPPPEQEPEAAPLAEAAAPLERPAPAKRTVRRAVVAPPPPPPPLPPEPLVIAELAVRWVEYAAAEPAAYSYLCGEGWQRMGVAREVPSPREHLQRWLETRLRELRDSPDAEALSQDLAMTLNGLARARMDGAPAEAVRSALPRLSAAQAAYSGTPTR